MVDLIPAPRASLAAAANREKKLADMLAALTDHYDYVFLDCPPAQGLLTPNALCAAERVLIPVELSPFAFEEWCSRRIRWWYWVIATIYSLLPSMVDRRSHLSQQLLAELRVVWPDQLASVNIRQA